MTTGAAKTVGSGLRADSLAESVAILMALTLVQPLVGFARGVLFCRWLDPEQLGQWDISLGFLTLAAPLVVLGIPGSFGRYVEYSRQRGSLRRFLIVSTLATSALTAAAVAVVEGAAPAFSQLIFGSRDHAGLVRLIALAVAPLVAFGFVTELLTAFRLYRVVSVLQLARSAGFLVLGAVLCLAVQTVAASIVVAYALASLFTVGLGCASLLRAWRDASAAVPEETSTSLWSKVVPFALWVWATNLLTNLFEIVDRYLIVHYSGRSPDDALELVGNYHSARVVPMLIVIFANMLASILTPHLSHAWETGRASEAKFQSRLALKLFALAISAGSAVFLLAAPLLFGVAFEGKYETGLSILPWTLVYCIWFGMAIIGGTYLWCREEARLTSLAMFAGMIIAIVLNVLLLPRLGLWGAVYACSASKLVVLLTIVLGWSLLGLGANFAIWSAIAMPLALLLGPLAAIASYLAVGVWALCGERFFTVDEKLRLVAAAAPALRRLPVFGSVIRRSAPAQPA